MLKRDSNTGVFLWILRMFNYSFLYRTPPVHYTFQKYYVMIKFFICLRVQNWYFSYFLRHCFVFFNSSNRKSNVISYTSCFYAKISINCNFCTNYNDCPFTILIESLKFRNSSKIIATYPGNLLWKMWIWVYEFFEYYAVIFFL